MSQPNRCPECGAELALGGLCPKCLLGAGLESRAEPAHEGSRSEAPTTPHSGTFVPPDAASLAAHFPHLEILELLGHGGMGAVYKARQPKLDRMVALKIIRPESAHDPAFAERFNREARMLARLSHPRIVAVYDFGEVSVSEGASGGPPRTLYFFLMEYVEGTNLRQLLQDGDLLPQQALAIVPQICEALQFAHDEGVVHRDIKPENILLDKRGRVKIADFGLAKLVASSPQEFTLTGTHQVMGTPRYMAPEQMEGSHAVDHRADIYSLGVVFYEMLTGEVPMGHFDPPSQKVEVDVRIDNVILRALARQPERRYQHASDVKSDVNSIITTTSPMPPSEPANIAWPYWRPSWQAYAAYSMVFALLLHSLMAAVYGNDVLWNKTVVLATFATILATSSLAYLIEKLRFDVRKSWRHPQNLLTLVFGLVMMLMTVLLPSPVELRDWLPSTTESFTQRDERYLRILALGLFLWTFYFTSAHVWFALGWLIRHGSVPRGPTPSGLSAPSSRAYVETAADREQIEVARQMVQFPAIGLLVIGILTLALAAFVAFTMSSWLFAHSRSAADGTWGLLVVPVILVFVSLQLAVITGAVKMLRLTDYGWAVGASVLAVSPVPAGPLWFLSLPIGIWALVVLSKPEVKRGFALRSKKGRSDRLNPSLGKPKKDAELRPRGVSAVTEQTGASAVADSKSAAEPYPDMLRLVQNPAWGLIITGVISWITIPLAFAVPFIDDMKVMNAAQRAIFQISFGVVPLVVGTIVALAGFRMKRLEGYWLAMFAAGLPIVVLILKLVGLSFGTLGINPADLVGAPVGLWVLVVLTRNDVKAAFHGSSPEHGAASRTARGTLGQAWDAWWAERDRWFTRTVLTVLLLVHIGCLAMFLTLRGGGGYDSGRPSAWHHVGWPTPWFVYERGVEPNVAFRRTTNLYTSSILIAGIGMLAWYAFWRVQLVRDARNARFWQTIGSPTAVLIMWIIAGAAFAWLGVRDAERLYDSMPTEKAASDSQPETEVPDVGKEQSQ